MASERKTNQQAPLWFRIVTGIVLPSVLILIGLHDVIVGQTLFVFSSAEFRENVSRYALVGWAARIGGAGMMGLGVGFGLRSLAGLVGRQRLPTDRLANPILMVSVLLILLGHWFLPGYVSLTKA
ncbi:MAG: hypothetical protein EA419_10965 [Wenzhouxiangella sp.]|nr:MAG: hypothetical protein EA370_04755 [Wenzhouxiangella sp.]TVS10312.1 MAG: hypothetical protein EA419_10965 [Wenzhouxiangella sp.]